MLRSVLLFLVFIPFLTFINGYNIFVYNPVFAGSHSRFMAHIADLLASNGHNVTVLEVPMNPYLPEKLSKVAKVVGPKTRNDSVDAGAEIMKMFSTTAWTEEYQQNPFDMVGQFRGLAEWQTAACEHILLDTELTEKMRSEKFDLGIAEAFSHVGFGMFKMYGIKSHVTVMSGLPFDTDFRNFGLTFPIAQIPSITAPFKTNISFVNRIWNLLAFFANQMVYNDAVSLGNELFQKYVPHLKIDVDQEIKKSAFYFLNTDPLVNYAIPESSKIHQIGGFGIPNSKPVNKEFDKILSLRKQNVIVSFGSVAKSYLMTDKMKENLFAMFRTFSNVTFIWKYEGESSDKPDDITNLIMTKWIPQVDILNDPRTTVFVTHAGMNSIVESSKYGVPLLTIPLYGDQPRNALFIESSEMGKFLDKYEFSENGEKLIESMRQLLNNPKYADKMTLIADMIKNRPIDPKEIFLKHVKFAAKFGNIENFDLPDKNMPLWKFAMLDILLAFVITLLIILSIIYTSIVSLKARINRFKIHQKEE